MNILIIIYRFNPNDYFSIHVFSTFTYILLFDVSFHVLISQAIPLVIQNTFLLSLTLKPDTVLIEVFCF